MFALYQSTDLKSHIYNSIKHFFEITDKLVGIRQQAYLKYTWYFQGISEKFL